MTTTKPISLTPVTVTEVAGYAKKQCKSCYGKGLLKGMRQGQPFVDACGCAVRQFFKHAKDVIRDPKSNAWFHVSAPAVTVNGDEVKP